MAQFTDMLGRIDRGQKFVGGLYDTSARLGAGRMAAAGDVRGAAAQLTGRGLYEEAAPLQAQAVGQDVLGAVNTGDYAGAKAAAIGAGDAKLYSGVQGIQDGETKQRKQFLLDASDALAQIRPGDDSAEALAERQSSYEQFIAPTLTKMGADPSTLSQLQGSHFTTQSLGAFKSLLGGSGDDWDIQNAGNGKILRINKRTGKTETLSEAYDPVHYEKVVDANGNETLVKVGGASSAAAAKPAPAAASGGASATGKFEDFWSDYLAPAEGGYAPNDGNGQPVNFGINQGSNPDVNVKDLTPERAAQIMHDRYWKPSGADQLPPGLAEIQADTAVNMGVSAAKTLLERSGGDPDKYMALREQKYRAIAAANPDKAKFLPTWLDRNAKLAAYVGGGAAPAPGRDAGAEAPAGAQVVYRGGKKPKEAPAGYRWNGDALEPIAGGPADPKNQTKASRKAEADLRKEFNARQEVKDYREVTAAYRNVKSAAANPSAPGDLSLIFAYMKMLDPGSVVREGEFATAQNAAGVPDRIVNLYNKARNGERLNSDQRQGFVAQAEGLYQNRKQRFDTIADEFRGYAQDYEIEPDRIVKPEATEGAKPAAAAGPRPKTPGAKVGGDGGLYFPDPTKPGSFPKLIPMADGRWKFKAANGKWGIVD